MTKREDPDVIRKKLAELGVRRRKVREEKDAINAELAILIPEAAAVGISPGEVQRLTTLSKDSERIRRYRRQL